MIVDHVIGSLNDEQYKDLTPDYVTIDWFDAFKKLHSKVSSQGVEVGIRLDNDILTKGLNQDDILYIGDDNTCIAVDIPPCEVIKVTAHPGHSHMLVKAAYEIGNRHATAFWGSSYNEVITPMHAALPDILAKIHGVDITTETMKLNFNHRISATVNNHTH